MLLAMDKTNLLKHERMGVQMFPSPVYDEILEIVAQNN